MSAIYRSILNPTGDIDKLFCLFNSLNERLSTVESTSAANPSGTVTSVGLTSADITVGGSQNPITLDGTFTLTLPLINTNVGTFGSSTSIPIITVDAKGRVTALSSVDISLTNGDVILDDIATQSNTTHAFSSSGAFNALSAKVDKVNGKNLSTNDFDDIYKAKLTAITGTNTGDETTTRINALYGYTPANAATLAAHTSNVSNPHSVTKAQVGLANVPNTDATNPSNIVTNSTHLWTTSTEKATWNAKQDALISGVTIRTINGNSLLGSGDLVISGGGSSIDDTTVSTTSVYSSNKVVSLLSTKVNNTLTINGYALSSNITLTKADIGLGNVPNINATVAANITQDSTHRFATDSEKSIWNVPSVDLIVDDSLGGNGTDASPLSVNSANIVKGYTVATLPTGSRGSIAYVTDASSPSWNATVAGGGSVTVMVFHNGTSWKVL